MASPPSNPPRDGTPARPRILLLNGTSSSGKSTLARALRPYLPSSFCFFASDQLVEPHLGALTFRPLEPLSRAATREQFFAGFHRAIAAFASAGNDLLVEHIVETASWAEDLRALLAPFDVFWVGVHAPLSEIEHRERQRGDRTTGEGRFHLATHSFCIYDLEVDSTRPAPELVSAILVAWHARPCLTP